MDGRVGEGGRTKGDGEMEGFGGRRGERGREGETYIGLDVLVCRFARRKGSGGVSEGEDRKERGGQEREVGRTLKVESVLPDLHRFERKSSQYTFRVKKRSKHQLTSTPMMGVRAAKERKKGKGKQVSSAR